MENLPSRHPTTNVFEYGRFYDRLMSVVPTDTDFLCQLSNGEALAVLQGHMQASCFFLLPVFVLAVFIKVPLSSFQYFTPRW